MKLKKLKEWLNSLPEEFEDYSCVNGEELKIDSEYAYRIDKPIVAGFVDEESKEIVLCHEEFHNLN